MRNTNQGTVTVGDAQLYYEMTGSDEPMVLCHAGFVDSRMWDGQWEEFSWCFRVVRFDMRDYGKSDRAHGPVSRRKDLEGLLDQLEIQRAVLMGCSLGGATILDFALEHPERVAALVVVSAVPGGFEMRGNPPADLLAMFAAIQQGDLAQVSELQLRLWIDGPYRQPEQVDPEVRQRAAEMNRIPVEHGTFMLDTQPVEPLDPPAVTRLHEIRVPTLIVAGALDNAELLRAADVMEEGITGAKKVIIPGAAHVPNMEKPEEFNRAVLRFLTDAELCDPL